MSRHNKWNDSGPGPVPPRWLKCPRKSINFIASRFVAFKTPLGHKFDDQVPPGNQFPPAMLLSSMKDYKATIGLWIDLTNTSRFYDKKEVEEGGSAIRYVKLHCRGHSECPSVEQVQTFVTLCDNFIRKNPLDMIAVHCTHGFNRTGFMIASYLVMKEDWSLDKALREFANNRPPGIYKKDYIAELYSRLDDPDAACPAPDLPDWCFEEDQVEDDDGDGEGMESTSFNGLRPNDKRRSEKQKINAAFMEGVSGVSLLNEQPKLGAVQRKIQDICGWKKTGFPGCQPVSMTVGNLPLLADKLFKVSWKADGTRYMMFIDGEGEIYLADRDYSIFCAPSIDFREKRDLRKHLCDTLLDGEMVIDIDRNTGAKFPRYLIYDAIRIHGKDIANDNFQMRFERIYTDIMSPRNAAIEKGLINKSKEVFGVRRKDFWDTNVQTTAKLLSEGFKNQLGHEPDGLIFQPDPDPYTSGRCDSVLKWKPPSHNSVDFKAKIVTQRGEGLLPTSIAELYVGGLDTPFGTMKANKKLKEYNGKIIECRLENNKWVFMRERTDKSFPNAFATATGVCESILNPVTTKYLLDFIEKKGYRRPDQELMPPPMKRPKH